MSAVPAAFPTRWKRTAAVVCAAVLIAAAGVGIYYGGLETHGPAATPFTWGWSLSRTYCPQCGPSTTTLATDSGTLFDLQQGNVSLYGNVTYLLQPYNWSTGNEIWPGVSIEVGEGVFGLFYQSLDSHADLVAETGILCVIAFGTSVALYGQVFEQSGPLADPVVWIIELNSTTGALLRVAHSPVVAESAFPALLVSSADGWIGVGVYSSPNLTISTFPVGTPSGAYAGWNETLNLSAAGRGLFEGISFNMSAGLVTAALVGNVNLATVIDGRTGAVDWQGALPNLFRVPGGANWSSLPSVVGPFVDAVASGSTFYFIANDSGALSLASFNFTTNLTAPLANLTGLINPINSQLSLLDGNAVLITDASAEHYWAFSPGGTPLWNTTLALAQVRTAGTSSVGGIDASPLPLGSASVLLCSMWSWSTSSYNGQDYPVSTFSIPLAVADLATGQFSWVSSYSQSESLGTIQNHPVTYWPLLTSGQFAAFDYYPGSGLGWSLVITRL